ncbi:glycosyltransferase family 2 protein [Curtobacterium sp. Leaf261]|uniref:glycosyltransferase family 2 protein n=1 Tax=Curtobacterium sp. Leaf261 TaxID=1736311 RepID=UPI0006F5A7C0|nr:glycosyltransferase [Curtobacterium sp. Leaf261]KQO63528.1 glycosyltransferase [Curtobacterium sp. Leaf261]
MTSHGPAGAGTVVITLCSAARIDHVREQQRLLSRWPEEPARVVVWLDDTEPPAFPDAMVVRTPPGPLGLRLAAGRNAGAAAAIDLGASVLVFLDADCVPGPGLVPMYLRAATAHPGALLVGPVTYLPAGFALGGGETLDQATRPHPARPAPAAGTTVVGGDHEYPLFWSLSFAVRAEVWTALGGFDEAYEGYGGEDTDFAFTAREQGVPLVWVGGADAYHQHHPTSSPPWQHLDDILRNGAVFAGRWGEWPMGGWLDAFAADGAIERTPEGWARVSARSVPTTRR